MIRDRSFLAFLAGEFVSRLGSQLSTLALLNVILTVAPLRVSVAQEAT
jgi:hypothetical protein